MLSVSDLQIESASLINIMPPTRAPQLREDHLGTLKVLRVDGDHAAGSDRNRSAKDDLHQTFVESCWENRSPIPFRIRVTKCAYEESQS